jgi:outer membrane protein
MKKQLNALIFFLHESLSVILFIMKLLSTLFSIVLAGQLMAQNASDKWDLRRCVDYAAKNNLTVKLADIQARIAALNSLQAKYNQYPNVSGNTQLGMAFGRSIDPTTNQFVNSQFLQNTYNVNANITLYNWGNLKNSKLAADLSAQAAIADIERNINDISLNIATFYLQVLSAKQSIEIAKVQIAQTVSQLNFTKLRVQAGALPELNAAELEAQLARDSVVYINADNNFQQALLQLKAAINLDMAAPFDVETPPVDKIPVETLADLAPLPLYQLALTNQPLQKANSLRVKASEKNVLAAKAAYYPNIGFGGGLGSNFANAARFISGGNFLGYVPTTNRVNVGGTNYFVESPNVQLISSKRSFGELWQGWGTQIDQNFRQNVGFFVQIPIFNNGSAKINHQQAKLRLLQAENTVNQSNLTLQQNIYQAHAQATAALQRFNAGKKTVETAEKSYEFARKRYEVGLANTLDVITNQNNLLRAKLDLVNNQFDYVFRMKVLEFYRGNGIKL